MKKLNNFKDIISYIDIQKGDILCISSDITKLLAKCRENKEVFNPNLFIDIIKEKIGSKGTILFPTFNWDFCKGKKFDYYKTPSQVGALGNVALKRKDFRRTRHPVYSFAVSGYDQKYLCNLKNVSAWGTKSPFSYLYLKGAKYFFIGIDYKKGFSIDHYFEERVGVDYRFFKNFTGLYSDENGKEKRVTFKMYVRKLEKNVYTAIHPLMDKEMIKKGAYKKYFINNIHFSLIDINIAGKIMLKDLKSGGGLIYPKKLNS